MKNVILINRIVWAIVIIVGIMTAINIATASDAWATQPESGEHKVTICHRTNSASNPYTRNTVDVASVNGEKKNDHSHHEGPVFDPEVHDQQNRGWGDIIPPVEGYNEGQNWNEAGQEIYNNGCEVPEPPCDATDPESECYEEPPCETGCEPPCEETRTCEPECTDCEPTCEETRTCERPECERDCEPTPEPTPSPTPEPEPTPEPSPEPEPEPKPQPEPQEPGDGGEIPSDPVTDEETLPETGPGQLGAMILAALTMLGLGSKMVGRKV